MVIFFEPVFKESVWGGSKLSKEFLYPCPDGTGEVWGISAHPHGLSKILDGPFQGITIKELWETHRELFGNYESESFPILVKFIDAFDDLSIQVHPRGEQAFREGTVAKDEFLYILACDPYTDIIIGHHAKNKAEFMNYIERSDYHHLIRRIHIKKGDSFLIEAGTLHAISKGTLFLEVEHSCDVGYRFYDYDRTYHGKKRPLQLRKAMNTVKIPDEKIKHSVENDTFKVNIITHVSPDQFPNAQYGKFFVLLDGIGKINDCATKKGDFGFVPSSEELITMEGNVQIAWITLV